MKTAFEEFQSANKSQAKPSGIQAVHYHSKQVKLKDPNLKEISKELKLRRAPIGVIILVRFFEGVKKYLDLPMIIKFPILLIVVVLLKLIG